MRPSMPMWLLSQSRRFPAPPDVWAHSAYPPDREEEYDQWAASQDPLLYRDGSGLRNPLGKIMSSTRQVERT